MLIMRHDCNLEGNQVANVCMWVHVYTGILLIEVKSSEPPNLTNYVLSYHFLNVSLKS
jgi:hypothetical protein